MGCQPINYVWLQSFHLPQDQVELINLSFGKLNSTFFHACAHAPFFNRRLEQTCFKKLLSIIFLFWYVLACVMLLKICLLFCPIHQTIYHMNQSVAWQWRICLAVYKREIQKLSQKGKKRKFSRQQQQQYLSRLTSIDLCPVEQLINPQRAIESIEDPLRFCDEEIKWKRLLR